MVRCRTTWYGLRDGRPTGTRLREFKLATQPESCGADDRAQRLFIGEERAARYLVVSSQGSGSFVVMDATPPHRVHGVFRIGMNPRALKLP